MNTKVIIKTNIFSFCGINKGSIGIIIHKSKNYYDEPVYDVKVGQHVLRLTEDEIGQINKK